MYIICHLLHDINMDLRALIADKCKGPLKGFTGRPGTVKAPTPHVHLPPPKCNPILGCITHEAAALLWYFWGGLALPAHCMVLKLISLDQSSWLSSSATNPHMTVVADLTGSYACGMCWPIVLPYTEKTCMLTHLHPARGNQ